MLPDFPEFEYVNVINGNDFIGGGTKSSAATLFIILKPWNERDRLAADVAKELNQRAQHDSRRHWRSRSIRPRSAAWAPPAASRATCNRAAPRIRASSARCCVSFSRQLAADPRLAGINTFYRASVPQLRVEVDREKALALGVPVDEVFDALQSTMSALYVNDFNLYGRTFRVQMQAEAPFRNDPNDLGEVYVRSNTSGQMIPLKALIQVKEVVGPELLERFNGYVAARFVGSGREGVSSGDAIAAVEEVAAKTLPEGFQVAWTGQAFQEKRTGSASAFAFGFAIVMVFLILAALYGRWLLPISVLLAVPFAVCGALALRRVARDGERHLLPDRPDRADRPRREERDPDRRVRASRRARRPHADRGRQGSGTPALPPDRHDVARVRARRRAARRSRPAPARPRGNRWAPACSAA